MSYCHPRVSRVPWIPVQNFSHCMKSDLGEQFIWPRNKPPMLKWEPNITPSSLWGKQVPEKLCSWSKVRQLVNHETQSGACVLTHRPGHFPYGSHFPLSSKFCSLCAILHKHCAPKTVKHIFYNQNVPLSLLALMGSGKSTLWADLVGFNTTEISQRVEVTFKITQKDGLLHPCWFLLLLQNMNILWTKDILPTTL